MSSEFSSGEALLALRPLPPSARSLSQRYSAYNAKKRQPLSRRPDEDGPGTAPTLPFTLLRSPELLPTGLTTAVARRPFGVAGQLLYRRQFVWITTHGYCTDTSA